MRGATRRQFLTSSASAAAAVGLWLARRAGAEPAWLDRREFGPFQCVSEFPLDTLDGEFQELAMLERELARTLALPPARDRIAVHLLADEAAHRALLTRLYPQVPYRRALYVQRQRQASVYAYRHPDLAVDLRHECTHALLHANLPMVPLWLDEGLAEYFEMAEPLRAFNHPHLAALKWNLRLGMFRTVESLELAKELDDMGGNEYRFSWAWVHFMLHGPVAAHRALVQYLTDIRQGEPPGQLSQQLAKAVPDVDERMVQHFKQWRREPGTTAAG